MKTNFNGVRKSLIFDMDKLIKEVNELESGYISQLEIDVLRDKTDTVRRGIAVLSCLSIPGDSDATELDIVPIPVKGFEDDEEEEVQG